MLLLLLFLPLDLHLRLHSDLEAPTWEDDWTGAIRWLLRLRWGRVVLTGEWEGEYVTVERSAVRILGIRLRPSPKRERVKSGKAKKKRKSGLDLELIWAMVEEFARFLRRLVADLGFRFTGEFTYGFADPSLTGWCEAIRWAVGVPVPIRMAPEFQRPMLMGWAEADGRIYGYEVALAALRALRNPVIRERLARRIRFRPLRYVLLRGG